MLDRIPLPARALLAPTALILAGTTPVAATAGAARHEPAVTGLTAVGGPSQSATIQRTPDGYRYSAWGQDNHLVITRVEAGLRFEDTGTAELTSIPESCRRRNVEIGIAAVCRVPDGVSEKDPMTIETLMRLGDDFLDTSTLSAAFELSVLADAGREEIHLGAGNDFVNGAKDRDRVWGGGGKDWIRTGLGRDALHGGGGPDLLVGVEGDDTIDGGDGDDRMYGGPADDTLRAGPGTDHVNCGSGTDDAVIDSSDTTTQDCESVQD